MSQFKTPTHLIVAGALCGALMLPIAAQAHGKRNDATKVTDAAVLPARKVAHFGKESGHKVLHDAKRAGETTEHNIGHVFHHKTKKSQ